MHNYFRQQLQLRRGVVSCRREALTVLGVLLLCLFPTACGPALSTADKQTIKDLASRGQELIARDESAREHRSELNRRIQSILEEERNLANEVQRLQDVKIPTKGQRNELVAARTRWYACRREMRQRLDDLDANVAQADREEKAINAEKMALQASAKAESEKLNQRK